jgi:glutathione S-transferase
MKLLASLTSPYARKVRIVLAEKKIEYELVIEAPWSPETRVPEFNPLVKIPVLLLDDGSALYDSRVIVEYLDLVSPVSRLVPEPTRQRIAVKRWEALADGVCDAAAAVTVELKRPRPQQSGEWVSRQRKKIALALDAMSTDLDEKTWCNGEGYSLADIATGCALGYLDLRCPGIEWRADYANLVRLSDKLAKRASFSDTVPPAA